MFPVIGEVSKGGGERGRYKYQDCLQDSNISASVRSMWAECLVVLLCSALAHSQHPVEESTAMVSANYLLETDCTAHCSPLGSLVELHAGLQVP